MQRAATLIAWQLSSSDFLFCAFADVQITMIVWQKLSSAREVLVEQEAGDVFLAGVHRQWHGIAPYGPMHYTSAARGAASWLVVRLKFSHFLTFKQLAAESLSVGLHGALISECRPKVMHCNARGWQ